MTAAENHRENLGEKYGPEAADRIGKLEARIRALEAALREIDRTSILGGQARCREIAREVLESRSWLTGSHDLASSMEVAAPMRGRSASTSPATGCRRTASADAARITRSARTVAA
jgi:hypothetical protein